MNTLELKQRSFSPLELERLQAAYDDVMQEVGMDAPLGLREAVAAEIMKIAARFQRVDEQELVDRIRSLLEDCCA